jgi:putative (di)nucleoside polyphosphate hydrolase
VGLALFNAAGKVFVGERIDTPSAWQMPQGGIDADEPVEAAAFRELGEEIGTTNAQIVKIFSDKIRYDLPPALAQSLWQSRYVGQEQTWVALRFLGSDADINLNAHQPAEFSNWKWVDLDETIDLIVPFKRETYKKVITLLKTLEL